MGLPLPGRMASIRTLANITSDSIEAAIPAPTNFTVSAVSGSLNGTFQYGVYAVKTGESSSGLNGFLEIQLTNQNASLSWNAVTGATSYVLLRRNMSSPHDLRYVTTTNTSYVDSGTGWTAYTDQGFVALMTSVEIEISADELDATTLNPSEQWASTVGGFRRYNITFDGFFLPYQLDTLKQKHLINSILREDRIVDFMFFLTGNLTTSGSVYMAPAANSSTTMTRLTVRADRSELITFTGSLSGQGELKFYTL